MQWLKMLPGASMPYESVSILTSLPDNVPEKAANDGTSFWVPTTLVRDPDGIPGSWNQPGLLWTFGKRDIYHHMPLCHSFIQIKKSFIKEPMKGLPHIFNSRSLRGWSGKSKLPSVGSLNRCLQHLGPGQVRSKKLNPGLPPVCQGPDI